MSLLSIIILGLGILVGLIVLGLWLFWKDDYAFYRYRRTITYEPEKDNPDREDYIDYPEHYTGERKDDTEN